MRLELTRIWPSITSSDSTFLVAFLWRIMHNFTSTYNVKFAVTRRTVTLLLGFCRCDCLNKIEIGFGVGELLDAGDLQAPVFVGDNMVGEYRFTDHLNPDRGVHPVGDLRDGTLSGRAVELNIWGTDVDDNLPWSVYDGMDGRLRKGFSHREVCSSSSQYGSHYCQSKGWKPP